jgi:RNase P subunit RPR2
MIVTDQIREALMFNGIIPPPDGSNRTICPLCSPERRKSKDRCMSIHDRGEFVEWHCHHCGWKDQDRI